MPGASGKFIQPHLSADRLGFGIVVVVFTAYNQLTNRVDSASNALSSFFLDRPPTSSVSCGNGSNENNNNNKLSLVAKL